jgi:hypothetical protein
MWIVGDMFVAQAQLLHNTRYIGGPIHVGSTRHGSHQCVLSCIRVVQKSFFG